MNSKKRYGDVSTHLHLTEKAQRFYNECSEISIFEYEDSVYNPDTDRLEPVYTYSFIMSSNGRETTSSGPETSRMSESELNAELEAMAMDEDDDEDED